MNETREVKIDITVLWHLSMMREEMGRITREKSTVFHKLWRLCDEAVHWANMLEGRTDRNGNTLGELCVLYTETTADIQKVGHEAGLFDKDDWNFRDDSDEFIRIVRLEILARLGVDIRPSVHGDE